MPRGVYKRVKTWKLSEETKRKISQVQMGHSVSEETRRKISLANKRPRLDYQGKNHPRWKGKEASYSSKHKYLTRNYGNIQKCQKCGVAGRKVSGKWTIEWAKRRDCEYTHHREDYLGLCKPCHRQYDMKPDKGKVNY